MRALRTLYGIIISGCLVLLTPGCLMEEAPADLDWDAEYIEASAEWNDERAEAWAEEDAAWDLLDDDGAEAGDVTDEETDDRDHWPDPTQDGLDPTR